MNKLFILSIIGIICIIIIILLVIRKKFTSNSKKCLKWKWDKKQPVCVKKQNNTSNRSTINFRIPISFKSTPRSKNILRAIKPPSSKKINIENVSKISPKFLNIPLSISDITGYDSLFMDIPIYNHSTQELTNYSCLLDTGSSELVIPTNICKKCPDSLGTWKGDKICFNYDIYNPKPTIGYGSGKISVREWEAPMIYDNKGINIKFKGIVDILSISSDINFIPSLCGLIPLYGEEKVSFIDQVLNNLNNCVNGFIMDLKNKQKSITFGKINKNGKNINLLSENNYKQTGLLPEMIYPIVYYAVKLKGIKISGIPFQSFPNDINAILDTGTSGLLFGVYTNMERMVDLYNFVNKDVVITLIIGNENDEDNNIELSYLNKKTEKTVDIVPDGSYSLFGMQNTILVGLPFLIDSIISYDLENKKLIFNE